MARTFKATHPPLVSDECQRRSQGETSCATSAFGMSSGPTPRSANKFFHCCTIPTSPLSASASIFSGDCNGDLAHEIWLLMVKFERV